MGGTGMEVWYGDMVRRQKKPYANLGGLDGDQQIIPEECQASSNQVVAIKVGNSVIVLFQVY